MVWPFIIFYIFNVDAENCRVRGRSDDKHKIKEERELESVQSKSDYTLQVLQLKLLMAIDEVFFYHFSLMSETNVSIMS